MSDADLEREYTPSEWNKRFNSGEEIIQNHLEVAAKITKANKQKYKNKCLAYGPGKQENMDVYYKEQETDNPIYVHIHGGYWQMLTKEESGYVVEPFVKAGYRVIVLDYDLCPAVTLEELVVEIKKAMKFIFKYAKETNARSLVIGGHSAGGHLVAKALEADMAEIDNISILKSAIFISGVYDLTVVWKTKTANDNNILTLDASNAKGLSPNFYDYSHLKKYNIPLYVYVAADESPTFIEQSRSFADHLKSFGLNCEYRLMQNLDHFDIAEKLAEPDYEVTKIIMKHLK